MSKKRTIKEIEPILPEVKRLLQQLYADRLVDVILYGSFARNMADDDSDIDVAVVLKDEVNPNEEINRSGDVLYDLMLRTDELISIFPVSEREIRSSAWPLYHHILREGRRL